MVCFTWASKNLRLVRTVLFAFSSWLASEKSLSVIMFLGPCIILCTKWSEPPSVTAASGPQGNTDGTEWKGRTGQPQTRTLQILTVVT